MVATRRSLGGQPSPTRSSPPAAAPEQLSRAQQAALKKLQIAGTDALKGDAKAAQAAKEAVQTYHYRGAVYAADANTPSSWIENQPKRYLKRSRGSESGVGEGGEGSIAGSEEREEDEEEEELRRRPAKRSRHSMPHQGRNVKQGTPTTTSSRGKARAARGGRQSLPSKRRTADADDHINMSQYDYTVSGGQDDRAIPPRTPDWVPESTNARKSRISNRAHAVPVAKSRISDTQAIDRDIQRRKQEAARNNYQVRPLGDNDVMSEQELARVALVKLARKQRLLNEKLIEYKMAKELLEIKKREAGLGADSPINDETAPEQHSHQQGIDMQHTGSSQKGNEHELDEQWEREQSQNRMNDDSHAELESRGTSPVDDEEIPMLTNKTYHPFTRPGASRPPVHQAEAQSSVLTGSNALPHSSRHGYAPDMSASTATAPNPSLTPGGKSLAHPPINPIDVDFATLSPNGPLPNVSAGGDPLRWTIQRRTSIDQLTGAERAEYAIDVARLEGESKSAKVRRIKRERAVVESWSKVTGAGVVEWDGRSGS